MSIDLQGKVVLISGASSGFGADAARLFGQAGCRVVLAARRLDRLEVLAEEIRAGGGEALAAELDVSSLASINRAVKTAEKAYGRIDILFNNAGFGRLGWLERLDPQKDVAYQVAVNLTGLIQLTGAVLPGMIARRSGHIINMSSMAGWVGSPSYTVYAATKFGVRGFTETLRREVSPFGIRVSGIYPAGAETEFGTHTGFRALQGRLSALRSLSMTSLYVAKRVVRTARCPRRTLILPWWMRVVALFNASFSWLVDWFLKPVVRRMRQAELQTVRSEE